MSITETTKSSWFSRLGGSIKGILLGIVLLLLSFPFLFWNEGEAVKTAKSLKEGSEAVISVENDTVDANNEGVLIHVSGLLETSDTLTDDQFGITTEAIKLKREVEMYQWQEVTSTTTEKKLGGGEETTTTYDYKKDWYSEVIDSDDFKESRGHDNPAFMQYESGELVASNVTLGAFTLSSSLINYMSNYETYSVTQDELFPSDATTPPAEQPLSADDEGSYSGYGYYDSAYWDDPNAADSRGAPMPPPPFNVSNGSIYVGDDPQYPDIGDLRITFKVIKPTTVSIVAQQAGESFKPFKTSNGKTIEMLSIGEKSADEMFESAIAGNNIKTWVFRLLGFLIMYGAIRMIFKPLSVVGDIVPFIGSIIEFGTGIIAFVIAFVLSLITIAIAWIFYRPLVGILLLIIAAGIIVAFKQIKGQKRPQPSTPPPPEPTTTADETDTPGESK